jgi:WD40 repeat protein
VEVPSRLLEIISVGQPFGGKPDTVIPGRDNLSTPKFSPNGKYVAVGFREVLWLGQVNQCMGEFTGCAEPSILLPAVANRYRGNVVFSPSGEYVTYGGRVWRLKDGKAVFTVSQSAYWLDAGGWTSRNGKIVGLNTATGIALLDLEKLVVSLEVEGSTISTGCWECAFSADNQLFVSKQGEILRVRKVRGGEIVFTFSGIPNISSLSFSPDGRFLIVINSVTETDYTVNFWGIPNGD